MKNDQFAAKALQAMESNEEQFIVAAMKAAQDVFTQDPSVHKELLTQMVTLGVGHQTTSADELLTLWLQTHCTKTHTNLKAAVIAIVGAGYLLADSAQSIIESL